MRLTLQIIKFFTWCMMATVVSCDNDPINNSAGQILYQPPLVIAHRGYHHDNKTPENSFAAFQEALTLNIWGIECDIRQTKDSVFVINHNEHLNGRIINESNYSDFAGEQLSNGESLPRLESFLVTFKKSDTPAKLLLDLKSCNIDQLLTVIKEYDLIKRVLFISFNKSYCDHLVSKGLGEQTYYLGGDMSPVELKEAGYAGINYEEKIYRVNATWIEEAQSMGMKVIVWTINNRKKINDYIKQRVIVTTDKPMNAEGVVKMY